MNSEVLKIFDVIEDIKHVIKQNHYKIVMDWLMKLNNNKINNPFIKSFNKNKLERFKKVTLKLAINIIFEY